MMHVLPAVFKSVNNLICCKRGLMWIAKRATSLFNSFCSNDARHVGCFLHKLIYHANAVISNGGAYTRSFLIHLNFYRALQKKNSRET